MRVRELLMEATSPEDWNASADYNPTRASQYFYVIGYHVDHSGINVNEQTEFYFADRSNYQSFDEFVEELVDGCELVDRMTVSGVTAVICLADLDEFEGSVSGSVRIITSGQADAAVMQQIIRKVNPVIMQEVEYELQAASEREMERKDPYGYRGLSPRDFY